MKTTLMKFAAFAVLSVFTIGLAGCGLTPPAANCFSYASEDDGPCQFKPLGTTRWDQFDG
ncbi:hypothetical protein FP2506_00345 [Fulvimarina pelagi HTCC2506]|uniref:Lipoprotein n=1 Tax=Fulvimarina pelagi HTCC2506 TaxID=314231 RepID=Q0FXR6_9HYPH|nr:hypothetical protein [Fulvimarina pelagi]EAU39817.1 hypothetical protein FP2506_00345 [Fulvimarina pelagi HTCC2506]